MPAYSFQDVTATLTGPGGTLILGAGSGAAEEGIVVTPTEDRNQMVIGADGSAMHNLNANRSGTITVNLLKTSSQNAALQALYDLQTLSSAVHGLNTILVVDTARGDVASGYQCAFKRQPEIQFNKNPRLQAWVFDCGECNIILGAGVPDVNI